MGSGGGSCSCAVDTFVRSLTAVGTNVYVGTDAKDVAGIPQADHGSLNGWRERPWVEYRRDRWLFPTSAFLYGMANDGSNVYATGSFPERERGSACRQRRLLPDGSALAHPLGSIGAGNGPWIGNGLAVSVFEWGPVRRRELHQCRRRHAGGLDRLLPAGHRPVWLGACRAFGLALGAPAAAKRSPTASPSLPRASPLCRGPAPRSWIQGHPSIATVK